MSGFQEFDFGNPVSSFNSNKWKPKKGKYRVSFGAVQNWKTTPVFNEAPPSVVQADIIYCKGVGYYLDHGKDFRDIALKIDPKTKSSRKIATTLIFWPTDSNGQIDKDKLSEGKFEVKNYLFSRDKFNQLVEIHRESPLGLCDIKINCTDEQFHKMNFVACRESVYAKIKDKDQALFTKVAETVKEVFSSVRDDMAQDLTLDQIREKLSGDVGSPVGGGGSFQNSSFDASDVLDDVLG